MSKEYSYFEAMEEIIKDESKVFIGGAERNKKLFYNRASKRIRIAVKSNNFEHSYTPVINCFWINTKWTLIKEKKRYSIRVYEKGKGKLIKCEIVTMTEDEVKAYGEKISESDKIPYLIKGGCRNLILVAYFPAYKYEVIIEEIRTT